MKLVLMTIMAALCLNAMPATAWAATIDDPLICSQWSGPTFYSVARRDFSKPIDGDRKVIGIDEGLKPIEPEQFWPITITIRTRSGCSITAPSPATDISSQLGNANSNKCLDKSRDAPNGNGNAVYQYTCATTQQAAYNQLWQIQAGGGSFDN
ncbi:RICIN domain-containing protein [Nonomuraea sp. PA05]|uniref:RICIN domain-containing protein n=1 Tax=Nonomuraea sp. PA05 TaxID=2604466 RepID=UPI0011D9BF7A|nr:RICIN domain-containing protein [Nonomuraea sp. PA05]TYB56224.1 RICIN domain-containing protein [Nonomuraea sp. PA05]